MFGLGWQELVIVLVIIMIIFGAGKLPEVAKSLGQGVKEFKQEANAPVEGLAAASASGSASSSSSEPVDSAAAAQAADRARTRADEI